MKRQKTETMVAKRRRNRGGISLFSRDEGNHKSDTGNDTDPNQAKNKGLLQFWVAMMGKLQTTKKEKLGMVDGKKKERPGDKRILYSL